jgi:sodium transport system permease protein
MWSGGTDRRRPGEPGHEKQEVDVTEPRRWAVIAIIWRRELRDLLRDRRTLLIIIALPILLYPVLGLLGLGFALGTVERPSVVGVAGGEYLPPLGPSSAGFSPVPATAWLTLTPGGGGAERAAGAVALWQAARLEQDYPPLLIDGRFAAPYFGSGREVRSLLAVPLDAAVREPLDKGLVDLILIVPPEFRSRLDAGGRPVVRVISRDDERSRLAFKRLEGVLGRWKDRLKEVRFRRLGLPADFDDPVEVVDGRWSETPARRATDELLDLLARVFPFLIVMWSLVGALYPAIDLCAGEKERGTLETLLVSPAAREEIAWGKFLAIWVFSAATGLWNLACLGALLAVLNGMLPYAIIRPAGLAWCALLALPQAALFSAVSLALGVSARSTKEGQYYLMPVLVVTLPLIFITLLPGIELNAFYSLLPVTGAALLLKQLLMAGPREQETWFYFLPVLASLGLYVWLALRWAITRFQSEDVLVREAERLDLWLRLRRLFRKN